MIDFDQLHEMTKSAQDHRAKIDHLIDLSRGYHIALLALLLALHKNGSLRRETAQQVLEAALLTLPADRQQSATATVLMRVTDLLKVSVADDGGGDSGVRDLQALFVALTASMVD